MKKDECRLCPPGRFQNMAAVKGLPAIPSLGPDVSLNRYLAEIRKFPILAPQEEYMLAKRWREHQDPEAAARLVTSHLRPVAKIAMGSRGQGPPVAGLYSNSNIVLLQSGREL